MRWVCPECLTSLRCEAQDDQVAQDALQGVVREHLDQQHPGAQVNAYAAAGWLAAAGHPVELFGGPFDGAGLWLPPGPIPDAIGTRRTAGGQVVPVRLSIAMHVRDVEHYRRGEPAAAQAGGRRLRYLYAGRPS